MKTHGNVCYALLNLAATTPGKGHRHRHACKSSRIPALFPHIFTSKQQIPMPFTRFHFYFYFSYPSPKAEEKR